MLKQTWEFTLLAEQSAGPADLEMEGRHLALGLTCSHYSYLSPNRTSYFNFLKKINKLSYSELPLPDSLTGL